MNECGARLTGCHSPIRCEGCVHEECLIQVIDAAIADERSRRILDGCIATLNAMPYGEDGEVRTCAPLSPAALDEMRHSRRLLACKGVCIGEGVGCVRARFEVA